MSAWTFDAEAAGRGGDAVTLVEGATFCISAPGGDITPGHSQGLFSLDTRVLSRWQLHIDDQDPEPLTTLPREPFRATFLSRVRRPGRAEGSLLVERDRRIGTGMREDIVLRNLSNEPVGCTLTLDVGADFADIFQVKEDRVRVRGEHSADVGDGILRLGYQWRGKHRGLLVEAKDASEVRHDGLSFQVVVPARGEWRTVLFTRPVVEGRELVSYYGLSQKIDDAAPVVRLRKWGLEALVVSSADDKLDQVLQRSHQDLGSLRIFDPGDPEHPAIAAGAPWFMALFGRDSLLSSWMALPLDPAIALGTLKTLATYQGTKTDQLTEEQPGRILHEVRLGVDIGTALGGGSIYYGTADATPLFVALLGELQQWGGDADELARLLPHADRALEWVEHWGDRDGDGFVEYQRATDHGLVNQGWKDSWDGINFASGRLAEPPIALCEVQGYVYRAYLGRAALADTAGDDGTARRCRARAAHLKQAFNERFWLPDRGYYAIALDRDKQPVDACASNMGHALLCGIVDDDKAQAVADRLMSPQMFTGWGVRTLASDMGAYNPMSYHNGSVWPHDSALVAAGLMRYGFVRDAQRVASGLLDAAATFGGRLPELFCGFDRHEYPEPVPYPSSCSPQAWAAAAPLLLMRLLFRFDPALPSHKVWLAPAWPKSLGNVRIENILLAGSRLTLEAVDDRGTVLGLPDDLQVVHEPLSWRELSTRR